MAMLTLYLLDQGQRNVSIILEPEHFIVQVAHLEPTRHDVRVEPPMFLHL
jgi:hypothetical protein